jgi:Bifunctional DNA primase/polymerase, N-terminal/AAA domain/Primase C terminal 1 (PriCT-1)/Winged helix-turn-helix DNA-binding
MHDRKDLAPGFDTDNTRNILEAARQYSGRGFSVIPVGLQKRALIQWAGYQKKQPSSDEIQQWFEVDFPNANVAIVTGQISGLVVLDLDKEDARETLKEHLPVGYDFSKVPTSITARGVHNFFKHPGYPVKNGINILPGIDIRADGGYVIAPPSIHETGKRYEWAVPLETGLPPLPEEIHRLLEPNKKNAEESRERFDTVRALNGVPDGQRDDALFKLACKCRYADLPRDWADRLVVEAAQNCNPPFPTDEALKKVANAYEKYEPGRFLDSFPHLRQSNPAELNLELMTWEQFLSVAPTAREWTVHEMIPETGLGVIQGRGKHGKSTKAIHLCRSVSMGKPFLSRHSKQKPTVYINYEMPNDYLQQLIRSAEVPSQSFVMNRPEPILRLETIKAIVSKVGSSTGLLVIDSFRGAFKLTGKAENLAGEAGVLLRQLQDLAIKTGWFFLVVHHRNRSSREGTDSISGTGDWIAVPDVILTWWRPEVAKPGTLTLEGRIPPFDPISVKLTLEECTCLGTVKETKEATDKDAIAEVLTDEGQTSEDIAEATGLPSGTTRSRLKSMLKDNLVARSGNGKKGEAYLWSKIVPQENSSYSAETNAEKEVLH